MKQFRCNYWFLIIVAFVACNRSPRNTHHNVVPLHGFTTPTPPATFSREQQLEFLRYHYWDRFRFTDTLALAEIDSLQLLRRYGQFISYASQRPTDRAPLDTLMRRAAATRPMFELFVWLADEVLHNPNSPLRNDELYIPVLEAQLAAPWYDEYDRIGPAHTLRIVRQNRIGHRANDFCYTTADGRTGTLHAINAEYTLIFFNNPDCAMCKMLRQQIGASTCLNRLIGEGRMKVLALYPDEDLTAWQRYRSEIPPTWINAYDAGCHLRETEAYALNAIPSLYLLDRDKRVIVKDAADATEIEAAVCP